MILETDAQCTRQAERLAVFGPIRFPQEQDPLSVMLAARSGYSGISQSRDQACGFAELTVIAVGIVAESCDSFTKNACVHRCGVGQSLDKLYPFLMEARKWMRKSRTK